jgi:hypothetical protein
MNWKFSLGKVLLVFGAPPLILAFFGALMLLLDAHGAGFWEVELFVRFVPFFIWGVPLSVAGIALLWSSSRDK